MTECVVKTRIGELQMEDNFFSASRISDGISAACDAVDGLGLTLLERWWVFAHLEVSARAIIAKNSEDASQRLAEIKSRWDGTLPEIPVEPVAVDGVAYAGDDEGDYEDNGDDSDES